MKRKTADFRTVWAEDIDNAIGSVAGAYAVGSFWGILVSDRVGFGTFDASAAADFFAGKCGYDLAESDLDDEMHSEFIAGFLAWTTPHAPLGGKR